MHFSLMFAIIHDALIKVLNLFCYLHCLQIGLLMDVDSMKDVTVLFG
jgi:hypothetical protein